MLATLFFKWINKKLVGSTRRLRIKTARELSLPDLVELVKEKVPKGHDIEIVVHMNKVVATDIYAIS